MYIEIRPYAHFRTQFRQCLNLYLMHSQFYVFSLVTCDDQIALTHTSCQSVRCRSCPALTAARSWERVERVSMETPATSTPPPLLPTSSSHTSGQCGTLRWPLLAAGLPAEHLVSAPRGHDSLFLCKCHHDIGCQAKRDYFRFSSLKFYSQNHNILVVKSTF